MPAATLLTQMKALSIFVVNGQTYLGAREADDKSYKFKDCIQVTEPGNEEKAFKDWIKAKNINSLKSFELTGGNNSVSKYDFSERQELILESVVARAELATKYAVKELENKAIDKA
jgi:hypothetical protein